ncbi:hypothetical protein [Nitrosopumilus sp.]|uniref:hypothetical protein n=1 Tax=Nitrosopumilus sp. TaxID=2024843 RepID=UPI00292DD93B|nr:hypothetical protein [Nitrosopumilus sp.]
MKCAECLCVPQYCNTINDYTFCTLCKRNAECCCILIHNGSKRNKKNYLVNNANLTVKDNDDCCLEGTCNDETKNDKKVLLQKSSSIIQFFKNVKGLYAAALGIEILCISAAEIGENLGLYIFGFNIVGIPIAYALGYMLAGLVTFVTILGRYDYDEKIDSCCSILGQNAHKGFVVNLQSTFKNFVKGWKKITKLHKQKNLKPILKSSLYILVTAESACILTAETVGIVFYQYSIFLSVPLALLVGAFTVVVPQAYKMNKKRL